MNRINPRKLFNSKWTAATPERREKHFMVVKVISDEEDVIHSCVIEAIISKRQWTIDWHELKSERQWLPGWR